MSKKIQTGQSPCLLWGAWSLLAAGLIVSALAARSIKTGVERAAQREFEYVCDQVGRRIGHRLDAASLILRSGAAFLDASESVTREDWRIFTRRLEMEQQLPGIQGIGFSLWIPPEQLAAHIQTIRDEGFSNYQISPPGEREIYSSIIFLEPFSDRNRRAFGYDMLSEPVRRAAMDQARDENAAALSGKVTLVQETGQDVQAGSLLYVPVYRQGAPTETIEQRRAAIRGWVYSPYRMTDLIHGTLKNWEEHPQSKHISLQIYDGDDLSANGLLYMHSGAGNQAPNSAAGAARVIPIHFAGHRWTLRFAHPGRLASPAEQGMAWLTLSGGMIISLLLFGLMRSLIHMRARARQLRAEIAERKRADEDATMAAVYLNTMPDTLIVTTSTAKIITVNKAFSELWGYTSEEAVGKPVLDFFPEDEWSTHRKEMESAITEGTIRHFEPRILTKHGNLVPVALSGKVLLDESGHVSALIAVIRDITERKRAEAEREKMLASARQSRRALLSVLDDEKRTSAERTRLAAAIEQSAETIMITDAQGSIVYVNPAFETTTGYSRKEILGQNPRILQSGKYDAEFYREIWATLTAGRVWRGHFSNQRKDGTHYEEEATISPVLDSAGTIVNYVGVKRDTTREVELEAQLRQAQKLESIGTLAGGVAHEINNPVMGIMNYAQLIVDQLGPDSPATEYATEIGKETERVATIVKNLLSFARVDKDTYKSPAGMCDIVAETLSLIQAVMRHDQIALEVNVPANLPKILCRSQQIRQVLMNLLTNARDALNQKYPGHNDDKVIVVSAELGTRNAELKNDQSLPPSELRVPRSAFRIRLTVEDHGPGIPKELRERIFDPFFSTKGHHRGTGLGLSISHGIVKDHGGTLSVESEVGQWTRFHVDLPVERQSTVNGREVTITDSADST